LVGWQVEQAEEFRQEVEQYTDAERVVLADAYQDLLRYGPLPHPGSPLEIHRLRDPRAGDAYVLVLPQIVLGYQVLGGVIVVQRPMSSGRERHQVVEAFTPVGWRMSGHLAG
jgi:hypothetical protein